MNLAALLLVQLSTARAQDADAPSEGADAAVPVAPDRSRPPAVEAPVPLALPSVTVHTLRPGVTVEHLQVPGVRKVNVQILFHQGAVGLCGAPSPRCSMLSRMWDVAGEDTDAEVLEATLDRLDADLTSWIGRFDSGFELTVPKGSLDEGLALMDELLKRPAFPRKDTRHSRKDLEDWYTVQAPNDLRTVASMARMYAVYPPDHPRGTRPDLKALKKVRPAALRELHAALVSGAPVTVQVIGDLPWDAVEADITSLLEGIGADGPRDTPPPHTPLSSAKIVAVDMPGQPQAAIRVLAPAPARGDDDRVEMSAVNFALGGSFTSRLNGNLREDKGWTYGAYSSYTARETHGDWSASVDVEAENVAAAIAEIQVELGLIAGAGPTPGEISAAWLDQVTWWNRRLETDATAASFYQNLLRQEESVDALSERLAALKALTPAEAQATAATWLGAEAPFLWVIVGDRSAIEEQVSSLGLPVTWLTTEQVVMGEFAIER